MRRTFVSLLPFAAASAVHVAAKLLGARAVDRALKPALVPLLALRLAPGPRPAPRTGALLVAHLASDWVADVAIDRSLRAGVLAFLAGHVSLIALFVGRRGRMSAWSLLLVPWLAALLVAVRPAAVGPTRPLMIGYAVVLGTMTAVATRGGRRTGLGGLLFLVSDTLLVLRRFTTRLRSPRWGAAVMASYLAAQALLVDGVLDRREER